MAGFADEVLQQVMVHVGEGLRLRDGRQVVNTELEAELLQILHMKSWWTDSMRKRTNAKDLKRKQSVLVCVYGSVPKPSEKLGCVFSIFALT